MFFKRLGYFMIGLSIGIVFLTFFLKKKSDETGVTFCYLPNCRVLKDIRSKPISFGDEISGMLQNKKLDSVDLKYFFTEGNIDFSQSDTKSSPCKTYIIEGELGQKEVTLEVKNCPNKATVTDFR